MKKILVAMSGGVDSSTAAHLLKQEGYEVVGAFMHVWRGGNEGSAHADTQERDARRVAEALDIPLKVYDFQEPFKKRVVDYFVREYRMGRTPNPCCVCNPNIKFDLFLKKADELGMDGIATGHYVQTMFDQPQNTYVLKEGIDQHKDQSYFLFLLSQTHLSRSIFPLGSWTKEKIKKYAQKAGYFVTQKEESQEICFIPHDNYYLFLKEACGFGAQEGAIRDTSGRRLGTHTGYYQYTIGQRKGLGIGAPHPLYVVAIKSDTNEVIVGKKEEALRNIFMVHALHWISGEVKSGTLPAQVRVRYNQKKVKATVEVNESDATVTLLDGAEVITPGQAAVFYDDAIVLGGGWIA